MTANDHQDILVVDDHQLYCDALSFALQQTAGLTSRIATDVKTARSAIAEAQTPMIVLLDLMMPHSRGLETVEEFVGANGDHKVIVVSSATYDSDLAERLNDIGVKGFIPKTMRLTSIGQVIQLVRLGDKYFPYAQKGSEGAANTVEEPDLTELDRDIIERIAQGETNRQIAHALDKSDIYMRVRVQRIYGRLGARNRAHAVSRAMRLGVIELA